MFLEKKFSRWKGGSQPSNVPILLGADSAPTSMPTGANDNVYTHRTSNSSGWPVQRLVVGYKAPSGNIALTCTVYVWDANSQAWFQIGSSRQLMTGKLSYFDSLGLNEAPQIRSNVELASPGSTYLAVVISDGSGNAPNGEHVFVVGSDITNTEGTDTGWEMDSNAINSSPKFRDYTMGGADINLLTIGGTPTRGIMPLTDGSMAVTPVNPVDATLIEVIQVFAGVREDIQVTSVKTVNTTAGLKFRAYW